MEVTRITFHAAKHQDDKNLMPCHDAMVTSPSIYFSLLIASQEPYTQVIHKKNKLYRPFENLILINQSLSVLHVQIHQLQYSQVLNLCTVYYCHANIKLPLIFQKSRTLLISQSFCHEEYYLIYRITLLQHRTQELEISNHPKNY